MQFGVSTQLYHQQPLRREHLAEIRSYGFGAVEIVATRSHVDYHDAAVLDGVAAWLAGEHLRLHAVHAPVTERFEGRRWVAPFNNASPDAGIRERAVQEARAALEIARRVPVSVLVVHLGLPDSWLTAPTDNSREAARRSVEEIVAAADPLGVRVALEIIPNALATAESLVSLVEDELDLPDLGICLDFGHAHIMGHVLEAIETVSGTLIAAHVHDNHGRKDEHLPPFEGTIGWPGAVMAL
ncbi:MAG: sugar phosphate isomerase/epimerase, partial [Acidobacteria bacterium]|nr:sugar phosphate isomerase/epimerase [Acidobacteriota bacterium]